MKIFLISNLYPSIDDRDYGIFVRNIEDGLQNNGAEIVQKAVISGRTRSFFEKLGKYKKFYLDILSAYRKNDFDLIYLHFISHSSPGLLLARGLFGKKKKLVINIHGSDILKYHKGLLKFSNKKLLRTTDLLVVPSAYFKGIIETVFPDFPESKIFISPSGGLDTSVFYSHKKFVQDKLHLGFVSRIEDDKGWRTFLKALHLLKNKNLDFKVSIAGTGSKTEAMKALVLKLNLQDHVDYLGILSHTELSSLYNDLDLFVFPTQSNESLGLVGLEAMACGVPVIGSEIAGLKTFIDDKKNGWFFTPGNEAELAEKITNFYKLPHKEKDKMRNSAIQTAIKYEKNKVAYTLYQKFEQLLS